MTDCRLEHENCGTYVLSRVIGPVDPRQIGRNAVEIIAFARQSGLARVLVDCTQTDISTMTIAARFLAIYEVLKVWDFSVRMALWLPQDPLDPQKRDFAYQAAQMRLINVQGFDDLQKALDWLRQS
ncbi:hypothetical protein HY256_08405 [Candidatus Sumerlaeota bacterium]|nr:hypothetical protein [Candidatus Sumerlaeota bacterium]